MAPPLSLVPLAYAVAFAALVLFHLKAGREG